MTISWTKYSDLYINQVNPTVEGWFEGGDLILFFVINAIQQNISIDGDICEVGSHHGKSAIALAKFATPTQRLWIFDLFYEDPGGPNLRANLAKYCPEVLPRLSIQVGNTREIQSLPTEMAAESLRWLHIDANHEYDWVMNDLTLFTSRVRQGGIIVMDDFFNHEFPGVPVATVEFLLSPAGTDIRPFASSPNKIYLCHRDWLKFYQNEILNTGIIDHLRMTRFIDTEMLMCFSNHGRQYQKSE
jgi:hypothetical protein